jgi:hypothetical protein
VGGASVDYLRVAAGHLVFGFYFFAYPHGQRGD